MGLFRRTLRPESYQEINPQVRLYDPEFSHIFGGEVWVGDGGVEPFSNFPNFFQDRYLFTIQQSIVGSYTRINRSKYPGEIQVAGWPSTPSSLIMYQGKEMGVATLESQKGSSIEKYCIEAVSLALYRRVTGQTDLQQQELASVISRKKEHNNPTEAERKQIEKDYEAAFLEVWARLEGEY